MKGTVVMRFIGNRQEPEEEPIASNPILFLENLSEFNKEMEAFYEWARKKMIESLICTGSSLPVEWK
jgi:hypothetical protein